MNIRPSYRARTRFSVFEIKRMQSKTSLLKHRELVNVKERMPTKLVLPHGEEGKPTRAHPRVSVLIYKGKNQRTNKEFKILYFKSKETARLNSP